MSTSTTAIMGAARLAIAAAAAGAALRASTQPEFADHLGGEARASLVRRTAAAASSFKESRTQSAAAARPSAPHSPPPRALAHAD